METEEKQLNCLELGNDDNVNEEEDVILDIVSCFPNGECSRTSPGNHSTVRRWKQRIEKTSGKVDENSYLRTQSAVGFSPLSIKTPSWIDLSGPSSAPSTIQWGEDMIQKSCPVKSVETERPRVAFNIASIVEDTKRQNHPDKFVLGEYSNTQTSSGHSIPVGIAVGRQRATQHTEEHSVAVDDNFNINSNAHAVGQALSPQHVLTQSGYSIFPFLTPHPLTTSTPPSSVQSAFPSPYLPPSLLQPPPLQPTLYPLPASIHPAHYPQAPLLPPSIPDQAGYSYQTASHPDPSYYLYLQHQLLLLHHHHLQLAGNFPHPAHVVQNIPDVQAHLYSQQNDEETANKTQSLCQKQDNDSVENAAIKTNNAKNAAIQSCPEDLDLRIPNQSNSLNEENISVDDEKEADVEISVNAEEDLKDAGNDLNIEVTNFTSKSFYSFEKGMEFMNECKYKPKNDCQMRRASTDCYDHKANVLGNVCEASRPKPCTNRVERSKSLDHQVLKNVTNKKSDSVTNFIHKKSNDGLETEEYLKKLEIPTKVQTSEYFINLKQNKFNDLNKNFPTGRSFKSNYIMKENQKCKKMMDKDVNIYTFEDELMTHDAAKTKEVKTSNNFLASFNKFKKSYLASNENSATNPKVSVDTSVKYWPTNEYRSEEKNIKGESNVEKELFIQKVKSEVQVNETQQRRKPAHEKYIVSETYILKKVAVEVTEEDFSQYKHKKIRRISKDSDEFQNISFDSPTIEMTEKELRLKMKKHKREQKLLKKALLKEKKRRLKQKMRNFDKERQEMLIYKNKQEKETETMNIKNQNEENISRVSCSADLNGKKKKKKKEKKRKKEKHKRKSKDDIFDPSYINVHKVKLFEDKEEHQQCKLMAADLVDGLRILKRIGSNFYPGRLTEISAPDIYGIVIDKERGNKPHIFTQEEVLNEAVLEMKPIAVKELQIGTRVCAFWSNQMNYLHPGTVAGPDIDPDYVVIQLDDGDSRDIHIGQVRYLPENYPFVVPDQVHSTELLGSRKRVSTTVTTPSVEKKKKSTNDSTEHKKHTKHKSKKKKHKDCEWSVSVTEVSNSENKSTESLSDDSHASGDFDDQEVDLPPDRRISGSDKSAISAFLPPQHLLWSWADEGHKLSAKARKVYHDSIEKEDETMNVGDCAVFLSTGRPDRPYIGRIHSMWQTSAGSMKVQVRWFYHPAEVEGTAVGGGRVEDIKTGGALFSSSHYDENDVQTISHKCTVNKLEAFTSKGDDDTYYLAGEYDPLEGSIIFMPGIF